MDIIEELVLTGQHCVFHFDAIAARANDTDVASGR